MEGDAIVTKTRLFIGMGSTECGSLIQYPTDPSHWNYFHFHRLNGIYWRPVSPEADGETSDFELIIRRERSCEIYQSVFHNFPHLEEWPTKDVFRKHPTVEDLWEYRYRIDDVIVFSTGEKMNPVPLEHRLSCVSGIKAALVFGNKQRYPGLLLEIDHPNEIVGFYSALPPGLKESVKDTLRLENAKATRDGYIHESMILVARQRNPFIRTPKGTIHRNMTLESYKTEVDELYRSLDIFNLTNLDQVQLDSTSEGSLASDLAELVTKIVPNSSLLSEDDDIFAAGLDSSQAQILTAIVNQAFAFRHEQDDRTLPALDVSIIYANPTIRKLAQRILQEISSPIRGLEVDKEFHQVLQRQVCCQFCIAITEF
jgi:Phosphopantetheine attachment site